MDKKIIFSIVAVLLVIVGGVGYVYREKIGLSVVTAGDFVKPLWARLECMPSDTWSGSKSIAYPQTAKDVLVTCGNDEFTDECRVKVSVSSIGIADDGVSYTLCNNDGTNCGSQQITDIRTGIYGSGSGSADLPNLIKGKAYKISCYESDIGGILLNHKDCNILKTYRPWGLYDYFGGGKRVVTNENCAVPTASKTNILSNDYKEILYMDGGEGMKWVNYVHDWVYGPANNVFTHPQYGEVYCTAGKLYSIVKVTTASGKIQDVDPSYNGVQADGTVLNGLGSFLTSVECCPSSYNCGDDFKWSTPTGHTCTRDADCAAGGADVCKTATSITRWSCSNGQCKEQAVTNVQCCSNTACPNGQVCQLGVGANQYKCIQQSGTNYCGDGKCDPDETKLSCNADCGGDNPTPVPTWLIIVLVILAVGLVILTIVVIVRKSGNGGSGF